MANFIPYVVERTGNGERSYDIFSTSGLYLTAEEYQSCLD